MSNYSQRLKRINDAIDILNKEGANITSANKLFFSIGMSRQAASSYATGKRAIGTETLNKLTEKYNINPAYILYGHTPVLLHKTYLEEQQSGYNTLPGVASFDQLLYREQQERIDDLRKFISRLEKSLDDKDKIIRLLESNHNK